MIEQIGGDDGMDFNISDSDLLRYAIENGIINYAVVAEDMEKALRQKYLDMHNRSIWQSDDGFYRTKLPKGDGSYRMIKRTTRAAIEKEVIDYYKSHSGDFSFKSRYDIWVERQRIMGRSDNTIDKYRSDYNRFFAGYPIEKMDIRKINDETIAKHLTKVLSGGQIRWRALKDAFGYMDGTFEKAIKDHLIDENPCKYIDLPIFKTRCFQAPVKSMTQRTLSDKDMKALLNKLHHPIAHNTNIMANFAIEFAILTGARVGEISALMWEDVFYSDNVIYIHHSEKYNRVTKEYYVSLTKNGKERVFPLTDQIKDLFDRIREYETNEGILCEYIFVDKNGCRMCKSKISDAIRNKTMSDEFSSIKSIHAIRRTVNSRLKCSGVSTTVASSLLGHTERVNEQNYTYDILGINEKKLIIENMQLRMLGEG